MPRTLCLCREFLLTWNNYRIIVGANLELEDFMRYFIIHTPFIIIP